MNVVINEKVKNITGYNEKTTIICGASYHIARAMAEDFEGPICALDFSGTVGNKDVIPFFQHEVWQWLMFSCISIIALIQFLESLDKTYTWIKQYRSRIKERIKDQRPRKSSTSS